MTLSLLKEVSKKGHRIAAERDRTMCEGRAILRKYDEEKHKRDMTGHIYPNRKGNDGLSKSFPI